MTTRETALSHLAELPCEGSGDFHPPSNRSRAGQRGRWTLSLARTRLAEQLYQPKRFIVAADPGWHMLAVVLEGAACVSLPGGPCTVAPGEAVVLREGASLAFRSARWIRLLLVAVRAPAVVAPSSQTTLLRDSRPGLEQIARIGRNARSIGSILERTGAAAFDTAVDDSILAPVIDLLQERPSPASSEMR